MAVNVPVVHVLPLAVAGHPCQIKPVTLSSAVGCAPVCVLKFVWAIGGSTSMVFS